MGAEGVSAEVRVGERIFPATTIERQLRTFYLQGRGPRVRRLRMKDLYEALEEVRGPRHEF